MNSTSTSRTILKVENLDISYHLSIKGLDTARDVFIKAITRPAQLLFKKRRTLDLLAGVSFELKHGERLGILGVNGAGKTSLCRAIAGMHGKNKAINVDGNVRAIFDTTIAVQPELTGAENAWILTNLLYSDKSKAERKQIVADTLKFSELGEFANSPFKHYSKGMKSRLFLSVVSARPANLLILDEVFSGADVFFNEKISKRTQEMIHDSGAVIFISHEVELIEKVCDRVIVLQNKGIKFDGPVKEGIEKYYQLNDSRFIS